LKKKELKYKLIRSSSTISVTSDKKYTKLIPFSLKNKKYFSSFDQTNKDEYNDNNLLLILKKENEKLKNKNNDLIEKLSKLEIMNIKLIKEVKMNKIYLEKSLREFNILKEENENLLKIISILNIKGIDIEEIINNTMDINESCENKNNFLINIKKNFNFNNNVNNIFNKTNSCKNINKINKELDDPIYNYTPFEFKNYKLLNNSHINEMNINVPKLNLDLNNLALRIKNNNKQKSFFSLNSFKFSKNGKIKVSMLKNKLIKKNKNNLIDS
jgi:hypothetical protein